MNTRGARFCVYSLSCKVALSVKTFSLKKENGFVLLTTAGKLL